MPPAVIAATIGAAGGLGAGALASRGQARTARTAEQVAQEELAIRRQILSIIQPFAQQLINLGIDPQRFIQSSLGTAILSAGRQAISGEFDQARMNLIDTLGASGVNPSGGLGAGPLANLFGQEALAHSNLTGQLPLQGLNLGLQGAGILQGINPSAGGIGNLLQIAGQSNLFNQSLANLPAAIAGAINQANQARNLQSIFTSSISPNAIGLPGTRNPLG